jgi:hypothetical protein
MNPRTCPYCVGKGQIGNIQCPHCKGSGVYIWDSFGLSRKVFGEPESVSKTALQEMIERSKSMFVYPLILAGRAHVKTALQRDTLLVHLASVCCDQAEADTLLNTIEEVNVETARLEGMYNQLSAGKPAQELIDELLQEWRLDE